MESELFSESGKAKDFILKITDRVDWGDLSNDYIMDVGCGSGINSTMALVGMFPQLKRVIAIDFDKDAIDEAQYESQHPKVEYHVADIEDRSTLSKWEGSISKIISHFCLNCLVDQRQAFENMLRLLIPGGEAAVVFTLQADYFNWFHDILQRWAEFAEDFDSIPPISHAEKLRASYYEQMLKEIGYTVILCDDEEKTYEFPTESECKNYLTSLCVFAKRIPKELKKKFSQDAFTTFLKYAEQKDDGRILMKCIPLTVIVKKPEK